MSNKDKSGANSTIDCIDESKGDMSFNEDKMAPMVVPEEALEFTRDEERRLVRKIDLHLMPFIWLCYLFNSLDRSNVSNAKSAGMTKDLHFPYNGYALMLTIFYIPFCTLTIPSVMVTRRFGPRFTLPIYMLGWGSMATINAGARNFGGVVAIRCFLGAFEAGFIPSVLVYLTMFYKRDELAKRVAVFYSCTAISGAFSGLLSYGIFQIKSHHLRGWQILFLLEGGLTVFFSAVIFAFLPRNADTVRWLTEREKDIARARTYQDSSSARNTKFHFRTFFAPLRDWRFYIFNLISFCYGLATSVASNFLTQIIGRFHFSVIKTNLFTVAPYATAAIFLAVMSTSSDHFRERGFHLTGCLILVMIGCLILVKTSVHDVGVGYFATFLITMGSFTPSCIFHPWHQSNDTNEDGRAFRAGAVAFFGNSAGILSANIFLTQWEPQYIIPLSIVAGVTGLAIILVLFLRLWMAYDNRQRNLAQGVEWTSKDVPTHILSDGPKNPSFRHFL